METLIGRGSSGDLAETEAAVDSLAAIPGDEWVARDIMVLRLHTLLAKARCDEADYRELRDRYRAGYIAGLRGTYTVGRIAALTEIRVRTPKEEELTQPNGDAEPTRKPLR